MVDKVLCLLLTVAFFKDVSGNSAATTTSSKVCGEKCCANYRKNSKTGVCEVCPAGTFGTDCTQPCPLDHYGELCISKCNCKGEEVCVPAVGCVCNDCTKTVCPPGTFGTDCLQPCPVDYFGISCNSKCNCTEEEVCNPKQGCVCQNCNMTDTDLDETKAKEKISVQFLYTTLVIAVLCFILLVIGAGYSFKTATKRCQCLRTSEEQAITIGQANEERQEGADINFSTGPYDYPLESNSIYFTIDIDGNTPPNAGCYLTPVTKNDPYVNMESLESSQGNPYQNY